MTAKYHIVYPYYVCYAFVCRQKTKLDVVIDYGVVFIIKLIPAADKLYIRFIAIERSLLYNFTFAHVS